jgi:hypothetical protein
MFWLSIRFFFLSFALRFVLGEKSSVGLLSFFFPWGDRKTHPFVSLSLSLLRRARFGKPDLPFEQQRERERSSLRKKRSTPPINSRAKEAGEKKDGLDFSSHCGTRTAATSSRRVKDENAYIREQIYVTFRPPPRGMPPKFILPPLL